MDILRTYPLVIAGGALQQIPFSRRCRFLRPVDDVGWHRSDTVPAPRRLDMRRQGLEARHGANLLICVIHLKDTDLYHSFEG
jgi:hypothetical protein